MRFLSSLRLLLYPFSILYGIAVGIRNLLFNWGWLPSETFDIPIVVVGNLTTGGTGKTPFAEMLIRMLSQDYQVGVLSRGYGRSTKGFRKVTVDSTATGVGDEPLQMALKFPDIGFFVGEDRRAAIKQIRADHPEINLLILDDAFQHRYVKGKINILLTTFQNPYYQDHILPAGNLRESRLGRKRADLIVVTKSPSTINDQVKRNITGLLGLRGDQSLFFSSIDYGAAQWVFEGQGDPNIKGAQVLLVTGIANPLHLVEYLSSQAGSVETMRFKDHHQFDEAEVKKVVKAFETMPGERKLLLTTEKDATRLRPFASSLTSVPLAYLPITTVFSEFDSDFKSALLERLK